MAQLVARAVRDCEVVGSNPITLTIVEVVKFLNRDEPFELWFQETGGRIFTSGLGAVVARTSGGREVASSILVALTIIVSRAPV